MDLNKWVAIGKVSGKPEIGANGNKKQACLNFIVTRRTQQANGQWVDVPMTVPIYGYEAKADLIEKYVVDGQELALECHLMTWDGGNGALGFGMVVDNVSFGFKPKKEEQAAAGGAAGGRSFGPPM